MLALSGWTSVIAIACAVGALAILAAVTLGLWRRLKELNGTFQDASARVNEGIGEMRGDLDRISEGLEALRRAREEAPGPPPAGPDITAGSNRSN